jgi:SNF2 family DNA or RNA helicase
VGEDTIDERVMEIIETKKELGDFLVDGKDNMLANESLQNDLYQMLKSLF